MNDETFNKLGFKSASFANEMTSVTGRGDSFTIYGGQKTAWQGEIVDAAVPYFVWMDAVNVSTLVQGEYQKLVERRKIYPDHDSIVFDTTEQTTSDVSRYGTDNMAQVVINPRPYSKAAALTRYGSNRLIRDKLAEKTKELSIGMAYEINDYISSAIKGATLSGATTAGATLLYAGTATADSGLAEGDVLTVELINRASTILLDKFAYYWNAGTFTKSSGLKNAWQNEPTDPYVMIIGPKQAKALKDSDAFISRDKYLYSDVVISSGEIGNYLGVKIIVTPHTLRVAAGGTAFDGGSAPAVDIARCVLMKGRKAYEFVWGQTTTFTPYVDNNKMQNCVNIYAEWAGSVIQNDAIVFIDCSDVMVVA
jgi:N4-gp56 family major capsid protein